MVWTLHPETLLFTERYREHMGKYQWAYTWACQFSPSDTRLMVGGVANAVGGEMAIYDTGEWEGPPESDKRSMAICVLLSSKMYRPHQVFISYVHATVETHVKV